jgi:anti-sigma regulatory factor (Ser/Thr protein kinase)
MDVCTEPVMRPDPSPFADHRTTESHVHLDPVPASVAIARAFVRDALPHLSPEQLDTVILLTSELVTNAILHARTPVCVGIVRDDERLMVAVDDRLPADEGLQPRRWSHDRPGGRGLALVADLSDLWGTRTHSRGKSVWFVLPLTAAAESMSVR